MSNFKNLLATMAIAVTFSACQKAKTAHYEVIPLPQEMTTADGDFKLTRKCAIVFNADNEKMSRNASFLAQYIKETLGLELQLKPFTGDDSAAEANNSILLTTTLSNPNPEAYTLNVSSKGVIINGASEAGVFYGIQTLRKSLPMAPISTSKIKQVDLPGVNINDEPRFAYRGMMLDVSRHFVSLDFLKSYIDLLALHNCNRFHWHLSDDQGWRLEIKKYPLLTEIGSKRKETVIGHNSGKYDSIPYGGYYTQEQARELVAYAAERYITIIPEIDMPGHMLGALAAYPELGCKGKNYEVWTQWGVSDDVLCVGKDETLNFIKDVLTEVMDIFPSEYIHIGGDECPKTVWEKCPKCQARIKKEGIKPMNGHSAETGLQSWFIANIEQFVNSKGRNIIGWDEILEGGLAPNATVMSWRGVNGGAEAARQKHKAIMTPTTYLYFDYYQTTDIDNEPMAIGGYVPVETVYNYEPVPSGLSKEEEQYIYGVQANTWTEYMPSESQVLYMTLPRLAALSEVQWTRPEKKDYKNFLTRLPHLIEFYKHYGYTFAQHVFDVQREITVDTVNHQIVVSLSDIDGAPIHFCMDSNNLASKPVVYSEPIIVSKPETLFATVIRSNGLGNKVTTDTFSFCCATAHPITITELPHPRYAYRGALQLVDGQKSRSTNYKDGKWVGFHYADLVATIRLNDNTTISSVAYDVCQNIGDGCMDALGTTVAISSDGVNFTPVASETYDEPIQGAVNSRVINHTLRFSPVKTNFVRITALCNKSMPSWHYWGPGLPGFLFVDEISVN